MMMNPANTSSNQFGAMGSTDGGFGVGSGFAYDFYPDPSYGNPGKMPQNIQPHYQYPGQAAAGGFIAFTPVNRSIQGGASYPNAYLPSTIYGASGATATGGLGYSQTVTEPSYPQYIGYYSTSGTVGGQLATAPGFVDPLSTYGGQVGSDLASRSLTLKRELAGGGYSCVLSGT